MKLSREINILIAISMVILGTLCAAVSMYSIQNNSKNEREHLRELLMSERKNNLRDLVAGAYSVLDTSSFYESAQKALNDMRFGDKNQNHFLVVDADGMLWVDPAHPEFIGKVKLDMVDSDGVPYLQNIIAGAKSSKEGFVSYRDIPQGGDTPYKRVLYYRYFEKWKWVVCAGMYINDIENVLAKKEQEIQKTMLNQLMQISLLFIAGLLLSVLVSSKLITQRVVKPLMTIKEAAERIGQGDFNNNLEVKASREITHLAKSVQSMQISLDLALKMTQKMREQHKILMAQQNNIQEQQNGVEQKTASKRVASTVGAIAVIFLLFSLFQTILPTNISSISTALAAPVQIKMEGSTTVFPIAQEAAKVYMKENKNVNITVVSSGSGNGIKALIDGTIDIANSSRFIKEKEAAMAYEKGTLAVPFRIAYDCIVPIVHKNNPIKNIKIDQLKKIYSGEIKNWKALGGIEAPITIFSRDFSSGTFEVWNEMVMDKIALIPAVQPKESNSEIIKFVMEDPNSIGYIGLGHLDTTVKALSVNGVTASESTAINGSYPITRPLFMLTKGWPAGEIANFINYMLEPSQGQTLIKKTGYLSIYLPTKSAGTPCPECAPCPKPTPCPEPAPCPQLTPCPPCPQSAAVDGTKAQKANQITIQDFEKMSKKAKVILVQTLLNRLGYSVGGIDGVWGPKVSKAYGKFQTDYKIEPFYSEIVYPVIQAMQEKTPK